MTPEHQTERENNKYETLIPSIGQKIWRLRDAKITWKRDFWDPSKMLPRCWDWSKIFWDPRFSRYHFIPLKCKVQLTSDTLHQFICTIKWRIKGFLLCLWQILSPTYTYRTVELWSLFTTSSLNLFSLLWREARGTLYII